LYGGDPEQFSLDHRVFMLLTAYSVVVAVVGLVVNILAHLNHWATLITAVAPFILVVIYLFARRSAGYYRLFFPIVAVLLALIGASWFTNAGYNGNFLILIFVTFIALYVAAQSHHRTTVFIVFLIFSTSLIAVHYFFPESIIGYDDDQQRFYDLFFGDILYLTFLYFVLNVFVRSYYTQAENLRQSSKQLSESEEKYRVLVEESSDPVFSYDIEGRYLYVNRAFAEAVGLQVRDITGKSLWDIFTKEEADLRFRALKEVLRDREVKVIEVSAPFDGRFYQTTITPVTGKSGEVVSAICTAKDITERKMTEKALQDSYRRLELFFNQSIYGYYCSTMDTPLAWNDQTDKDKVLEDIDQHQFITEINDAMLEQYGTTREMLIGRPMSAFFQHDKETARRFRRELFDKGHLHVETFELKDNKTPVWIEGDYICTYDDLGRITGTLGVQIDISVRRKAEKEREKLQDQLVQTQKMESVGRLAGGVAHDFNNMLQAILGHVELALQKLPDQGALRENLLEIQTCAKRSADLTRQLLAFARKQTIIPKVIDLNDAVESTLKMLRRLIGEDIDLLWHPGTHLWFVRMDPSQIDQVLANLCVNARDAIEGVGKVTIRTENRLVQHENPVINMGAVAGEYVVLEVTDNGHGMNKEVLSHLFEPFFTTKDVGKGTGLGLAMVYGIIQQNHGFINVQSQPGEGTSFELFLPRYHGEISSVSAPSYYAQDLTGRETVLLVEDEPAILDLSKVILEAQGYTVLTASCPSEAIEIAKTYQDEIHLLLTDVIMPEMNGGDLATIILAYHSGIKLMFMSGYSADVIARQGLIDEGIFFIEKPFMLENFCLKVREALDYKSAEVR
jgi:PAS domain S-box-containing protein